MKFIASLLICCLVAVYSEPQYHYNNYYQQWPDNIFYRQQQGLDAIFDAASAQGRFFFTTPTITVATSTVTTTSTSTLSCTTSTASLSACVATSSASASASASTSASSGKRRRRRSNAKSSLFYREEDNIESIFLPSPKVERAAEPAEVPSKETPAVFLPFVVQPGMMARSEPQLRFLVAFTTATTTVTTSTTSTATLTAICSSTTSFPLCGSSGK